MYGSTRNVARVARPFPSTIKLSITKQERGKGLAGQTTAMGTGGTSGAHTHKLRGVASTPASY